MPLGPLAFTLYCVRHENKCAHSKELEVVIDLVEAGYPLVEATYSDFVFKY